MIQEGGKGDKTGKGAKKSPKPGPLRGIFYKLAFFRYIFEDFYIHK